MRSNNQVTVRGLDDALTAWLRNLADAQHRSLDKQVLFILEQYRAQSSEAHHSKELSAVQRYASAQGERLRAALAAVTAIPLFSSWTPVTVAREAGINDPTAVLAAFAGETPLPIDLANRISDVLTVRAVWLTDGTNQPYSSDYWRLDGASIDATLARFRELAPPDHHRAIHLLRSDSPRGELYVLVTDDNSPTFQLYTTPHILSEDVGSGGAAAIRVIFRLLKRLETARPSLRVLSHVVPAAALSAVLTTPRGPLLHPLSLVSGHADGCWAQDVWDAGMLEKGPEHWPGQKAFSRLFIASMQPNVADAYS